VRTAQKTGIDARAERRAMLAVVAVFALLFQALVPSLAAASADLGATPICRPLAAGSAQGGAGDPQAPDPGHHCQHCVCPATAGEPPPVQSHARVTYATALPPAPLHPFVEPPPARAPPRPPGQGPPPPNA
jgi:hypothetical protein